MTEHKTKFTADDVVALYEGAERKQYNFNAADVVAELLPAYKEVESSSKAQDIIDAYASVPTVNDGPSAAEIMALAAAAAASTDDVEYVGELDSEDWDESDVVNDSSNVEHILDLDEDVVAEDLDNTCEDEVELVDELPETASVLGLMNGRTGRQDTSEEE